MLYQVWLHPEAYLTDNDKKRAKSIPPMHTVDLHHLAQQDFTKSTSALKRWFLTAFVPPEDRYLLIPTETSLTIETLILTIHAHLNQRAIPVDETLLASLQVKLFRLFRMNAWIGVGLKLVDEGRISIDHLNTLILWQAGVEQFGETKFVLHHALISGFYGNQFTDESDLTLHQILFARLNLEYRCIHGNGVHLIFYQQRDPHGMRVYVDIPSVPLHEYDLANRLYSEIIPLPSFGLLPYEAFLTATFLGARPIQAYLPNGVGNLYAAHGETLGQSLITQHDYQHASGYREVTQLRSIDRIAFHHRMQIYALVANALVRNACSIEIASYIIDSGSLKYLFFLWKHRIPTMDPDLPNHSPEEISNGQKTLLTMFYNEMALAAGIKLDYPFICRRISNELDPNEFQLETTIHGQPLLFNFEINDADLSNEFADKLNTDFQTLKRRSLEQTGGTQAPLRLTNTTEGIKQYEPVFHPTHQVTNKL